MNSMGALIKGALGNPLALSPCEDTVRRRLLIKLEASLHKTPNGPVAQSWTYSL